MFAVTLICIAWNHLIILNWAFIQMLTMELLYDVLDGVHNNMVCWCHILSNILEQSTCTRNIWPKLLKAMLLC